MRRCPLAEALQAEGWVDAVKVLDSTAMPIIKLTGNAATLLPAFGGRAVQISVDISFDGPTHRGLASATYVRYIADQEPALRPLVLVLKQLLVERGLNDPYSGVSSMD